MIDNCVTCNLKSELFKVLSNRELERIDNTRSEVTFQPGEIIYKQGTHFTHFLSLRKGMIKTYIEHKVNRRVILDFIKAVGFLGGPGSYVDNKHYYSVEAIEESIVCLFDLATFRDVVKGNPAASEALLSLSGKNSIHYLNRIYSLTQRNAHGRVAEMLLYLSRHLYHSNPFPQKIGRRDLAAYASMNKDTMVRVFKDLQNDKIIDCQKDQLHILNENKLENIYEMS